MGKTTTYITAILALMLTFSACSGNKSRRMEPPMLEERDSFIIESRPLWILVRPLYINTPNPHHIICAAFIKVFAI